MFMISWVMDKLGYMPKIAIDSTWPFPAKPKLYTPHEFEQPIKKAKKKPALKKATTRKKKA